MSEAMKGMVGASNNKETTGAWVIHHGRKLVLDANGPIEFPVIDEAAKAATLLTKLGGANQVSVSKKEAQAIAVASGINPRHELTGLLQVLEKKRLIEQSADEVSVLGVTTRGSLRHAADMFREADPSDFEQASITLAEIASLAPVRRSDVFEQIGDEHLLSKAQVRDFLDRAEAIVFVDKEGDGDDGSCLTATSFDGNQSRRRRGCSLRCPLLNGSFWQRLARSLQSAPAWMRHTSRTCCLSRRLRSWSRLGFLALTE
jgi:hypothetical protein